MKWLNIFFCTTSLFLWGCFKNDIPLEVEYPFALEATLVENEPVVVFVTPLHKLGDPNFQVELADYEDIEIILFENNHIVDSFKNITSCINFSNELNFCNGFYTQHRVQNGKVYRIEVKSGNEKTSGESVASINEISTKITNIELYEGRLPRYPIIQGEIQVREVSKLKSSEYLKVRVFGTFADEYDGISSESPVNHGYQVDLRSQIVNNQIVSGIQNNHYIDPRNINLNSLKFTTNEITDDEAFLYRTFVLNKVKVECTVISEAEYLHGISKNSNLGNSQVSTGISASTSQEFFPESSNITNGTGFIGPQFRTIFTIDL